MAKEDSIGQLTRFLLYHFKSIEVRLQYSKVINEFRFDDKKKLNLAITKVAGGINEFLSIVKNEKLVTAIKKELDGADLVYVLTLTEQLFDLKSEDLEEITDMIDNYLKLKYPDTCQEPVLDSTKESSGTI